VNRASETPGGSSTQTLPRNVKLLGMASLLNDIASEMVYPLLSVFFLALPGASRALLGLSEGIADTVASLLKLWSGGWSDRAGRRRGFVILGYGLATVARPLIGAATAPWQVLSCRLTDRTGKGIRTSPRDALIADSTEPEMRGRAFGFHRAMDHLGAAIGPLLAFGFLWLWPDQLRTLFVITVLPGIFVVILLVFGLRETPHTGPRREPPKLTLKPFDRRFKLFLLALLIFTLGNSSDLFLLDRANKLGVSQTMLPVLWCVFHILKSFLTWLAGGAVDRFGPRLLIVLGWLIYTGIYLGFALATTSAEIWILFLTYALFYALTEPAEKTLVANLVGNERKGLAFGWYNFAIGIGALPASVIFGKLYDVFGPLTAFGSGAGLALVAAVMLLSIRSVQPETQDSITK
jgi:MFS family permease